MSERVNIYSGPTAPEGIQLANPGDLFIQVVEGSPDVGNLFYKGQGELGTGWVELQLGGGSAGVGGTNGQLQFNNDGSFDGAKFSSVDPSTGNITWSDGAGDTVSLVVTGGGYAPYINFSGDAGNAEIGAQGLYLASGAKITQWNSSSADVNQFTFQSEFNVADPVVSQYAAVVINATSSLTNPLDGIRSVATFTDNSATGTFARGGIFQAEITGSNVAGDSAYGAAVYVINDGYPGTPQELSGLVVLSQSNFGSSANVQTGIHILDQGQNAQALTTNAAILIDDQTAGPTVYSIKTGLGLNYFGDRSSFWSVDTDDVYGVTTCRITGTETDSTGSGDSFNALLVQTILHGSNVGADSVYGLWVQGYSDASGGNPQEVSGIWVDRSYSITTSAVIQSGVHIVDQATAVQASSINAAILIDDQTPGTTVFSIYTGQGDIYFGNSSGNFGIFGATPVAKQIITGVKLPSDTVLANLLTALANFGFLTDSTA